MPAPQANVTTLALCSARLDSAFLPTRPPHGRPPKKPLPSLRGRRLPSPMLLERSTSAKPMRPSPMRARPTALPLSSHMPASSRICVPFGQAAGLSPSVAPSSRAVCAPAPSCSRSAHACSLKQPKLIQAPLPFLSPSPQLPVTSLPIQRHASLFSPRHMGAWHAPMIFPLLSLLFLFQPGRSFISRAPNDGFPGGMHHSVLSIPSSRAL